MQEYVHTNVMAARAEMMALAGPLYLTPEIIDGKRFVRVDTKIKLGGLLAVAAGKKAGACTIEYTGGQI